MKLFLRRLIAIIIFLLALLLFLSYSQHLKNSAASLFSVKTVVKLIYASAFFTFWSMLFCAVISALLLRAPRKKFNAAVNTLISLAVPLGVVIGMLTCLTPTQFGIVSGMFSFTLLFSLALPKNGLALIKEMLQDSGKGTTKDDSGNHEDKQEK